MKSRIKPGDIVLIVLLVAAGFALLFSYSRASASEKGSIAVVEVNGREVKRIALGDGQELREFKINGVNGITLVEVQGGRVRVHKSECRDKICIGEGWVDTAGRAIVCLPNRVVVRVTGRRGGKGKVDSITE